MLHRSIVMCVLMPVLVGCQTAAAPDCTADATRYQVIHKLAAYLLGRPTVPESESEAAWKRIEDDFTSQGAQFRHHDGTVSLKSTKETIQFYLTDVRTQSHDEKLGSWECAATYAMKDETGKETEEIRLPVTYRSELADEGRSHYVSVAVSQEALQGFLRKNKR